MRPYLSKAAFEIFCCQIDNSKKEGRASHGKRYTNNLKTIALGIKYQSTKAYKYLRHIFHLPSVSTLDQLVSNFVKLEPGLSEPIFAALKKKVANMTLVEKNVILCFDEMAIKTFLSYKANTDEVEGFQDHGEYSSEYTQEYGSQALVIEAHGCYKNWKQPLGYLITNGQCPADVLLEFSLQAVDRLHEIGLNVRIIVSDLGTSNQSLFKTRLNIDHDNTFFIQNGKKIYVMYDPPHLMKCVRNNLISCDYYLKSDTPQIPDPPEFVASWVHFKQVAALDSAKITSMRLCPKIAYKTHVIPNNFKRMKVKYATQVLSHTVSTAMMTFALSPDTSLPIEAMKTSNFFKFMDTLFDCFNSSTKFDSKPYKCALKEGSVHFEFLLNARDYLSRLLKLTPKGSFNRPPCFMGFVQNINVLMQFWDDSKAEGITFLRTRLLSQDSLENLFGVIRGLGGHNDSPPVAQFRDALRQTMVSDALSLRHPDGNCEADSARILFDFESAVRSSGVGSSAIHQATYHQQTAIQSSVEILPPNVPASVSMADENITFYVAGVCVKKFIELSRTHDCNCIKQLEDQDPTFKGVNEIFTHFKAFSSSKSKPFGMLHVPSDNFLKLFKEWDNVFKERIDDLINKKGIISQLKEQCINISIPWFSENDVCRKTLYSVMCYFFRIRIFYMLKTINQTISDSPKTKENRKYKKLNNL